MAVVQGIKEKLHLPLYDSVSVEPEKQLRDVENSSILKFFVNVQGKTKLETNLQSASLLPHYNTFEARAMRVVISDLPPEGSEKVKASAQDLPVTNDSDVPICVDANGTVVGCNTMGAITVTADIELGLDRLMDLLTKARQNEDERAFVRVIPSSSTATDGVTLKATGVTTVNVLSVANADGGIALTVEDIKEIIATLDEKLQPPKEQLDPNNGSGTIIGTFIYNTVTTLFVGEKIMIQMPTWFFPAGAGPYSESARFTTHGEPDPMATFRFAEPLFIDKQQNFRVEIEIPDSDSLKNIQKIYGPFSIWVVLDGYMTRDVQ